MNPDVKKENAESFNHLMEQIRQQKEDSDKLWHHIISNAKERVGTNNVSISNGKRNVTKRQAEPPLMHGNGGEPEGEEPNPVGAEGWGAEEAREEIPLVRMVRTRQLHPHQREGLYRAR